MNEVDGQFYPSEQSPTTPAVIPAKDSNVRPHGDMLKMMNPTPNGYSNVPNHKPKSEGQEVKKHHESKNNIDGHKHSSDHVKKKDEDSSKHKSSHSKSKEHSKEGKSENQTGHTDKEKKHSSHSDSSKSKDSSNKHSDHSKHSNSVKKEDKHKSDSSKKEHHSSEGKPKTDNFKENEKIKDSSSKEKSKEHKDKHKDKHRDKEHKDKHRDKEHKEKHKDKSSSDKPKDKSDKPKEKSDKSKDERHKDKHSEKPRDKDHGEKSKDKEHSEKHKSKEHSEKHKDKEHSEKHKDKEHGEKHKDKEHSEKHKDKEHSEKHKENSEKHKEKHKDKHSEKHKEKIKEEKIKVEKIKVEKTEPVENELSPGRLIIKEELVKEEPMSEDDMPLSMRFSNASVKREPEDQMIDDEDDEPILAKTKKIKSEKKKKKPVSDDDEDYEMEQKPKKRKKAASDDEEYDVVKKPSKKVKKEKAAVKVKKEIKQEPSVTTSPTKKRGKKEEEEQEVWKWWEEEKMDDGRKWTTLEHNGPVFAPPYERVPKNVKFYYDGKHMELSEVTEEVAGFYGRMLDHEYTSKDVFNTNFFKDWRKVMTSQEKETIKDLKKCNFKDFDIYYKQKSEERKAMTKEEKNEIKKQNEELTKKYGFCIIDGHKQKIGNFKIEPPGLFRGRGEHPKMGMLKRRIEAEDILINIGKEAKIPEAPPGHKWKEVRHDNTVSWLASWTENILGSTKYIMLNPSSKLKGEKDWQKYETARKLKAHAGRIRDEYTRDFKSKEMKVRQRAVALYFIDKLALRAGNEKDEDTADTVGCCSLRVEHITLYDEKDGKEYVVEFDFLGKDSIRYNNSVPVEKRAYKNLKLFMENKQPGDDLFDRLNTSILNKYLNDLMEGLTAKVFRTYNASKTLQEQLDLLTKEEMSIPEKILAYNRANRAVAILCNHQRAVPKGFSKAMETLKTKIDDKEAQIKECKKELKAAKSAAKEGGGKDKMLYDKKKKRLAQLEEQLKKLEVQATDKEENKQIALGTSKLNYLDPRISVAWCKKWGVPIEKIYNRTQRDKFRWAIEMAGPDYKF